MSAALVRVERRGRVQVLTLDNPPVNSLSQPARQALWLALDAADLDKDVQVIVITGAGRGFCAGGELSEMHSPLQQAWPGISNHLLARIEACQKPVIAALHGFAVGGGFELALACHYRAAQRDTRIALPEIKHGVIPPSGSQRLPRAIAVDHALQLMVLGETVPAKTLAGPALFQRICESDVLSSALALASELDTGKPHAAALLRYRPISRSEGEAGIAAWRLRLLSMPQATPAMHGCIDAVEFAVKASSFDEALAAAKQLHGELSRLADIAAAAAGTAPADT
jgi:enoyl-CoA hydratase/carnithine racemase